MFRVSNIDYGIYEVFPQCYNYFYIVLKYLREKCNHLVPHLGGRNSSLTTGVGDSGGTIFPVEFHVLGVCTLLCNPVYLSLLGWNSSPKRAFCWRSLNELSWHISGYLKQGKYVSCVCGNTVETHTQRNNSTNLRNKTEQPKQNSRDFWFRSGLALQYFAVWTPVSCLSSTEGSKWSKNQSSFE